MSIQVNPSDDFLIDNHLKEKSEFDKKSDLAMEQNNNSVQTFTNNLILINTVLLSAMAILLGGYKNKHSIITAFIITTLSLIVLAIISALVNSIIEQNFFEKNIKTNLKISRRLSMKQIGKSLEVLEPREINTIVAEEQSSNGKSKPTLFFYWGQNIITGLAVVSFFIVLILVISLH